MPSSSVKQATADAELENDLFGFELVDTVTSAPPTVPQVNVRYYAVYALGRRARQLSPEL